MGSGGTAERPLAAGRSAGSFAVRGLAGDRATREPSAKELAWLGTIPCALIVVALIMLLGPLLGDVLFPAGAGSFIPAVIGDKPPRPEPIEQARFLLSLTAPLLLSGFVVLAARRTGTLRGATISRLVAATQVVALAFVVTCGAVQRAYRFEIVSTAEHIVYFKAATLAAAAMIATGLGAGTRSARVRRWFAALTRESRARRIAGTAVAIVAIGVWLLPAVNFDDTIGNAHPAIAYHMNFWLDEAFAVLDGRWPLADFTAQYGSLWLYPVAATMALLGDSIGVYTVAMAAISAAALLALFAVLRRVVRSTLAALALFVPLLATGLFMIQGPLDDRYAMSNLFGAFPTRYAGPLLLAWLLARQLDGAAPRRARWLFLAAGLVVLNNPEFGIPALGATFAALLWAARAPFRVGLRALLLEIAVGLAAALALLSVLTIATAGSLPHLELLFRYSRLFAVAGWGMLPMVPTIGMSTIVYLTYVAGIATATVRAVGDEEDRLLTGLLAFSGVFGLGVGSYYMGRSHPEALTNMFAPWALSVTLLFVVAMRRLASPVSRRPTLADAACLFAFGILVCSLPQVPRPWGEVARLQRTAFALYAQPAAQRFVSARTHAGESVAIFAALGHRAAYNLGIADVTSDTWGGYLVTLEQFDEALDGLAAEGGRKVFLSSDQEYPELLAVLDGRGYHEAGREPGMLEYATSVRAP